MHYAPLQSCSALRKTARMIRTPVCPLFYILVLSVFGIALASPSILGDENPVVPDYVLQYGTVPFKFEKKKKEIVYGRANSLLFRSSFGLASL